MGKILILASILFFAGCGGGGGSSGTAEHEEILPDGTEKMQAGVVYQVAHGDSIVKTSQETEIKITHKSGDENSTVELIEGEANLVRAL